MSYEYVNHISGGDFLLSRPHNHAGGSNIPLEKRKSVGSRRRQTGREEEDQ